MSTLNHEVHDSNQHVNEQEILEAPSNNPFLERHQQRPEKTIVYFDDYDVSPPSYDVAQESSRHERRKIHTSDADHGFEPPIQPAEVIPLNIYQENTSSEPETAPLMTPELSHRECLPSAPSLDQMQGNMFESIDIKTPVKKGKITLFRILLACCVWFVGITFMSVSLFSYECFDNCTTDQECDHCLDGVRKGGLALMYSFFVLGCLFATYKAVRWTLST